MNKKQIGLLVGLIGITAITGACGNKEKAQGSVNASEKNESIVMVTDTNGVDDRSFNQSAWEGMTAWGKENHLKKGVGGYDYIQSSNASEFTTNIDQALTGKFGTIFGVGFLIRDAIDTAAGANSSQQFAIIDSVIDGKKNVASATFKDHEVAYLAGVAAAYTTTTNKIGFIGGEEGPVLDRFEAGYTQGIKDTAKKLNKSITIDVKYAASFGDPAKGKAIAANMYQDNADIIYAAAGGTGAGVFQEAKAQNESNGDKKVWVIGADKDQQTDGKYKMKDGTEGNFTLTSSIKEVGEAIKDIADQAKAGKFPGGKHLTYGLKDGGVSLVKGNMSEDAYKAVNEAKQNIIDEKINIKEKPSK
ncbi:BMP family lipoprotein [Vagococcus vulneris]|uniref:BMP family ABC transporter substrate-binding protein n=1 Tax=Vagococcus vulneris TaxID=1977869 RepID=A0A429ZXZ3_9ENTE|nr:BMP family protein [Vagococcus vulneris]RST98780.1 BMP family ABC transporter substrate-binding protein [Vagococcus vulneris]